MSRGDPLDRPVMLLWGDDPGAIAAEVERIRGLLLGSDGLSAFNHERFDGPYTSSITQVIDACMQLPMMASRRLVELSAPEEFAKHASKEAGTSTSTPSEALEALCDYAEAPNPSTLLLVTARELRSNSRLVKAFTAAGVCRRFAVLDDRSAKDRLMEIAREREIDLAPAAASFIVDALGTEQAGLVHALERARAFAGRDAVSLEDARAVVVVQREVDVFALVDAVGRGDLAVALAMLRQTMANEKDVGSVQRVFALLTRHFRQLWTAKEWGADPARLGVPPFVAPRIAEQARRFDEARLMRCYQGLYELDLSLKGVGQRAWQTTDAPMMALQRWIMLACDAWS